MVSAYAARLRLTLATVAADNGGELEAAREIPGLINLKGKVVTANALHCNRATVAEITGPANIAILRRRALDMARRDTSKGSLSIKLKRAGWDDGFLLNLLNQLNGT